MDVADGFRCVHVTGVESDMELAYAGLQQLCAPLLHHLDELPTPQREALDVAFGRGAGAAPDRFLVGLAVLSLLAAATDDQPLLCVVDDAQWLDQVSVQTLAFVARRFLAEPVVLLFATRDAGAQALGTLPELAVTGLSDADARIYWTRCCWVASIRGCVTVSSPRRGASHWPCWRFRTAFMPPNSRAGSGTWAPGAV